tara:strand:+ start:55 stop:510 length:456 start_codon:yes stop_codon:yes gene_type:complete
MESMTELLLDYGSLGIFLAFMVYQYTTMQKRMDALQEKFLSQLTEIQEKAEEKEQTLRARYDAVIESLNSDKSQVRENVAGRVSEAIRKMSAVEKALEALPFAGLQVQIESVSLAQRNSHLLLEKMMEIKRKQAEEDKLRAMARKLSEDKD